ncbi:hypothetical protein [Leptothoe spongobia]|uniref:Type I restriction enzyme R protein N-terminal domain-containing protein n=1 Tax=Leptothoe spongobia TAU-MAC 1115 TaxID=1967444 RepID=A0A947DE30_9CYAN|nr:hypothetical protein [Leptothoe spongobia]MBT9314669.1 hypothetical protein [Leptothoe spongobia TAU-MAC 1115]
MAQVLKPDQSYTFSKIFDLKIPADELAQELGYTLSRKRLDLPRFPGELDRIQELCDRIEEILPYVDLASETSRREVLISRVVSELVHYTKAQLRIEYPIKVSLQLQGYLDYLLRTQTELLVIEAKRQDLDYGFTQLVAEMIALDQWDKTPKQSVLLGAITTGTVWQFGQLDRNTKHIEQGLNSYRAPEDLDDLMRILVAALSP